ncbi:MAG: MoxR family ATPase [Lachnospiraceae bacterium]|nr:MoxR family ATPase [Lachnospiraceae bacterium]
MIEKLEAQINEYFVGKEEVVRKVLICLLAGGHVLLEDVPGTGKTTLARTLAASTSLSFGRIQFTPDTLPSDVVGVSIYDQKTQEFVFREGAVAKNLVLADEINRTSPKTQASLLEAMAEGRVTVDKKTYDLPDPFMVIATQNPVEFIGTYPLPEAQTDRFMMKLTIGYPSKEQENRMLKNHLEGRSVENAGSICTGGDIIILREKVKQVHVSDGVTDYIRQIVDLTRNEERFVLGASPRAAIHLLEAARACAFMRGRDFVKPDDAKDLAVDVLHHRLVLTPQGAISGEDTDSIIRALLTRAKIPME